MTGTPFYIEVAVSLPVKETYTYQVPEPFSDQVDIGKRVWVPFGNQTVTGYILRKCPPPQHISAKDIIDILDETPLFTRQMVPFFEWISSYYLYPIGAVIKTALPGGININEKSFYSLTPLAQSLLENGSENLSSLETDLFRFLEKSRSATFKKIAVEIKQPVSYAYLNQLKKKGFIFQEKKRHSARTRIKTQKYVVIKKSVTLTDGLTDKKRNIVEIIREAEEISVTDLKKIHPTAAHHLSFLEDSGHISVIEKQVYRDPFGEAIERDVPPPLGDEQKEAVEKVQNAIGRGFSSFLLFGVTGSGKTEVYMHICEEALSKGVTAIVLVPEIALISQTERQFRARFGEKIAVLHSGLSAGERYDQWLKIVKQETPIVIGARSAIFAPLENIGVIIVDEEHDASYKQESGLRYNARDLALVRAKQLNGVAVLGSATPSVQSYYNVQTKKMSLITLRKRINQHPLPHIHLVDLKKNKDEQGIRRFITPLMHEAILRTLAQKEQVLLFLNRRGFANFPVCATCGETLKCPNCDVSLTLHKKINAYKCHFCGFSMASVSSCRICGSKNIKIIGIGTERVEDAVKKLFPEATVARMDQDTTSRKGALIKILKDLRDKKTDILVGTQMVAKGHDFPGITLVGIICADLSLNFPDFRSGERTFQLLAQVAGRAGRGEEKGRVILQTYAPEHFSIVSAQHQDFISFYNQEIVFRKGLLYPPYSRVIQITISGKDMRGTKKFALGAGETFCSLRQKKPFADAVHVMGPIESPIYKISNRFRWLIVLKSTSARLLKDLVAEFQLHPFSRESRNGIQVTIDVDPYSMV